MGGKQREGDKAKTGDDKRAERETSASEGAASGTFAVLRSCDFQAANAALNARNNAGNAAGNTASAEGVVEANSSESVYQGIYRSVFDRSRGSTPTNSVLESEDTTSGVNGKAKRRVTLANLFYIELRHGHLMLYDSAAHMEVRHVISLAHHSISLSEGGGSSGSTEEKEKQIRDGDLFIKRTAIVLTPTDSLPNGHLQSRTTPPKPFYLFSATCAEKEDFYHALLSTRLSPPIPEPLDPDDMIKLQSTLHATSMTPESRAFNALASRLFLALSHTERLKTLVRNKVEKKISRVQKPAFIASLAVQSIDLGDAAPILSNPRLRDLNISGDMTVAFDLRYTGGIKITFSAIAKLDLGPRFKTRTVDLVLATSLQRLQGHVLVRIKPPPSNRIWFCFESIPDMEIKVEPVVSQRQITYTFILRAIEERIRTVVGETLVKPNWDDVSFFDTRGQSVRGGIWEDEGHDDLTAPSAGELLRERNQKTMSMPVLGNTDPTDSSATSSGSETTMKLASGSSPLGEDTASNLKRRSVASLPLTSNTAEPRELARPPKSLRSPSSMTSPTASAPSVALDESSANFDPARSDDAKAPPKPARTWRLRTPPQQLQQSRREAVEAMREMRDRSSIFRTAEAEAEVEVEANPEPLEDEDANDEITSRRRRSSDTNYTSTSTSTSASTFANRSLRSAPKRTDTNISSTTSSSSASASASAQRKQTILAATAAATNAARNWSWNALQNARTRSGSPRGAAPDSASPAQEPMGRGRPLPPPGMPLPGPQQKGLWTGGVGGLRGFGSGSGSVRRKPVLPPRRTGTGTGVVEEEWGGKVRGDVGMVDEVAEDVSAEEQHGMDGGTPTSEFGPWRQNSGVEDGPEMDLLDEGGEEVEGGEHVLPFTSEPEAEFADAERVHARKSAPPPLPARRGTALSKKRIADPGFSVPGRASSTEDAHELVSAEAEPAQIVESEDTSRIEDFDGDADERSLTPDENVAADVGELIAIPAPVEESGGEEDGVDEVLRGGKGGGEG